jgi:3-oxoacyl-(acyl-carrier-protein) synthase
MRVFVEGVGLLGPGLCGWHASRAVLAGNTPYQPVPTSIVACELLPATERRRVGVPVKLALAVGQEAFAIAGRDAAATASVFTSSGGDGDNVHQLCEALATPEKQVSPTRFHNSVHNAAAGYWSIATQSRAASTSLCCHDASVAAGLLEAACQVAIDGRAVALIAYDQAYPEPLSAVRPISASFGAAMVLAPQATDRAIAELDIVFLPERADVTAMADPGLDALRRGVPAARCLPLLAALARGSDETIIFEYVPGTHLRVALTPCS